MNGNRKLVGAFMFAAATGCAVTLAIAWPRETQADDIKEALDENASLAPNQTKKGALIASADLVQDEKIKSRWYVELVVRNTTKEGPETAQFEPCVEMAEYAPMGRGGPLPTNVWKTDQAVTVPAGETVVVRQPLPSGLSWRIYKARLAQEKAEKTGNYPAVVQAYSTSFGAS
jgi:hypothetical protein